MKKKKLIIIISIIAALVITAGVVITVAVLGGGKCEHTYDNTCDATCNKCGEERAIAHTWAEADCTTPKTCTVCAATEGEALGHTPEADDGDCTTAVACSVCGETAISAKTNHIANADDGDCTTAVTCTACSVIITAAKSHDYTGAWQQSATQHWHICKNEGCEAVDGREEHDKGADGKCIDCGYTIAPHVHSFTAVKYDESGHWNACACGEADPNGKKEAHSTSDDRNCETAEVCACGYTVTAAKNHEPEADDGDCTTAVKCRNCDEEVVAANASHTGGKANCTNPASCGVCGKPYGEIDEDAHTYVTTYIWGDDFATCTATRVCIHNENHKETETVNSSTEDGIIFTAEFTNPIFEKQILNTIISIDNVTVTPWEDGGDIDAGEAEEQ